MRPGKPQPFDYVLIVVLGAIVVACVSLNRGEQYAALAMGILATFGYSRGRNAIRQGRGSQTLNAGDSEQGNGSVDSRRGNNRSN